MNMTICLVNMDVKYGDKEKNLLIMEKHIKEARSINKNINTIVFPELACSGYILEKNLKKYVEDINGSYIQKIKELAVKHKVNIISGFLENSNSNSNKPFNTSFAINKKGKLAGKYSKNHLFSQSDEPKLYSAGKNLCLFNLDGWKCGIAICFDIRFPRLFEQLAVNGAEIIFVPANWVKGKNKFEMLKIYTQARAGENQIYCASVDRSGKDKKFEYTGSWMLSDPIGNDITKTYKKIYHIGEVGKGEIKRIRKILPLRPSFKDKYKVIKN